MKKIFAIILAMGLSFISLNADTKNEYKKQKVVYHINFDDPKHQKAALGNIQNHINAVGAENLELRVVLHGDGLSLLLIPESLERLKKFKFANADDSFTARIDGLKNQGVLFDVCKNTIVGRNINVENDLYDVTESNIVPSGVAELAKLQMEGFTYIKP
jgi:intracellular sulfur oxidation DsrE/DsrF family protein